VDFELVAQQINTRLVALPADPPLRTIHIDPGVIAPPMAVLSYPDEIDPHGSYNRGTARMGMQLAIAVGRPLERSTPERLALWAKPSGDTSVLTWLEAEDWVHTAFDVLTVELITFGRVSFNEIEYMAVFFDLDIVGSGG
jgi:hypothetical protein